MSTSSSNGFMCFALTDGPGEGFTLSIRSLIPTSTGSPASTQWKEDSCQVPIEFQGVRVSPELIQNFRPVGSAVCDAWGFHGSIEYFLSKMEMDQRIEDIKTSLGLDQSTKFTATQLRFKDAVFEIINKMDSSNREQSLELAALTKAMAEQLFPEEMGTVPDQE